MNRDFVFGESEKGELCTPLHLRSLEEIFETLGHPPKESQGIAFAIQTLLFKRELIFYRIREEGFAMDDYQKGVKLLYKKGKEMKLSAIFLPKLGDPTMIENLGSICQRIKSLLILTEKDLFDYLTASKY